LTNKLASAMNSSRLCHLTFRSHSCLTYGGWKSPFARFCTRQANRSLRLFSSNGYASMLAGLRNGDAAEVGMIGREGMVGLSVILEVPLEAVMQAKGIVLRLDAVSFAGR
jgi:hypothetical protein